MHRLDCGVKANAISREVLLQLFRSECLSRGGILRQPAEPGREVLPHYRDWRRPGHHRAGRQPRSVRELTALISYHIIHIVSYYYFEIYLFPSTVGGDVPDGNFDLQMGDGGFGIFDACVSAGTSAPQYDGTASQWGNTYGGWSVYDNYYLKFCLI